MINKIKQYKADLLPLGGLLAIFIFLSFHFFLHQGSIIIDCFAQNAYIPMELLKGKVLYKDIIVPYGPFSYQINALLMFIFGQTLNTVYFAGTINSLIILLLTYLISRNITGKLLSFTVTFLVMIICVFHFWITNFNFPYSSAMTYSLTAFLSSLLFSIYYFKKSKPLYMLLAFVFITISALIKLDFIFFIPVLFFIACFIKPVPKKYFIYIPAISLIIPTISWSILFLQEVTFSNIHEIFIIICKFAKSEPFKQFYASNTGMFFNPSLLKISIDMFQMVIINLTITSTLFFIYFASLKKVFGLLKIKLNTFALFVFVLPLYILFLKKYFIDLYSNATFAWMPITATIILIFTMGFLAFKIHLIDIFKTKFQIKNLLDKLKLIDLKQRIFILVCIASIISAMRCYYFINLQIFGTFVIPLVLLVNIVFWVDYLPDFFVKIGAKKLPDKIIQKIKDLLPLWKTSWSVSLILLGIIFLLNNLMVAKGNNYPLKTSRGTYYVKQDSAQVYKAVITHIEANSNKNDSMLVIPRGLSLNFFTGLSSNNKYYDLIPPTIEVYGENKIKEDLEKQKPKFILVTNEDSSEWGATAICKDYALKICGFIDKNYKYKGTVGNNLKISIFEIKK
jgi:hypothetical protein